MILKHAIVSLTQRVETHQNIRQRKGYDKIMQHKQTKGIHLAGFKKIKGKQIASATPPHRTPLLSSTNQTITNGSYISSRNTTKLGSRSLVSMFLVLAILIQTFGLSLFASIPTASASAPASNKALTSAATNSLNIQPLSSQALSLANTGQQPTNPDLLAISSISSIKSSLPLWQELPQRQANLKTTSNSKTPNTVKPRSSSVKYPGAGIKLPRKAISKPKPSMARFAATASVASP